MADWIDYRMETWTKELADRLAPRLRVLDHQLVTRSVEDLMREAYDMGRRDEGNARADEIKVLRERLDSIRSMATHRVGNGGTR